MNIQDTYPVFEADQVLTNVHLNKLSAYLEQQERLTRNKLIGCGIVCGLEITASVNSIKISKGCALTSQGYLIPFCETEYTHYRVYETRDFITDFPEGLPENWPLIHQCGNPDTNAIPFYKPAFKKNLFQLVTSKEFEDLDADEREEATPLSGSVIKLSNYAVVLFLEAENLDLKNCDTNDCNDKGSLMDFDIKVLLVEKKVLDKINDRGEGKKPPEPAGAKLQHVELQRYNVPVTSNILTTTEVLKRFEDLVNDNLLKTLAANLNYCWWHYWHLLKDEPVNPFENLFTELKNKRDAITKPVSVNRVLTQYVYDFIDDLLKAYYEFKYKVFDVMSECCPDEMRFPFHVMLGEANRSTSSGYHSHYREYFIYSPLFDSQGRKFSEIRSLFTRMKLMVRDFLHAEPHDFEKKALTEFEKKAVKITPSRYGHAWLSDRCIPYYYKVNEPGQELFEYWNHDKSRRGNSEFNLGYNSRLYNSADTVINPLLYDIERFDFFRIEGHIGKEINTAFTSVKGIKERFNLPFDIVALSADSLGIVLKGEELRCLINDLDSDYRVLIVEFICKLHDVFCTVSRFAYKPAVFENVSTGFSRSSLETNIEAINLEAGIILETVKSAELRADHGSISDMVNKFIQAGAYKKGQVLSSLCGPLKQGTIGAAYISLTDKVIPFQISKLAFYNPLFRFIDNVESMFEVLLSGELADLNIASLARVYKKFESEASGLGVLLVKWLQKNEKDFEPDQWLNSFMAIFHTCIVERMTALKDEYIRRMKQYRDAKNFANYFRKHGGMEHKAGVPKGGTFILVYHEKPRISVINTISNTVIKEEVFLVPGSLTHLMKEVADTKELALADRVYASVEKLILNCTDMDDDTKDEMIGVLVGRPKPPGRPVKDPIPNFAVIADFYVPYLCCSDCPPVAYILPTEPQQDKVVFDIVPKEFLHDEAINYPFTISPFPASVSEITNLSNVKLLIEDGKLLLHPAMEIETTLKANLTYRGISLTVTIIRPDAKFTITLSKAVTGAPQLQFTALDKNADKYEWVMVGNTDNLVFANTATTDPILLSKFLNFNDVSLRVGLTVTYERNGFSSEDTKLSTSMKFEEITTHPDNQPFEPRYD